MVLSWTDPAPLAQDQRIQAYTLTLSQTTDAGNMAAVDTSLSSYYTSANPLVIVVQLSSLTREYNDVTKVYTNRYAITSQLQPYNNYNIAVALGSSTMVGPAITTVGRTGMTTPTSQPTDVQVSATYNSITVSFRPPVSYTRHGIITAYQLSYTRYGREYVENGGKPNERNNATVMWVNTTSLTSIDPSQNPVTTVVLQDPTQISAYTVYSVQVLALVSSDAGPYTDVVNITTSPRAPVLPPVPDIVAVTQTTVTLSWPVLSTEWGPITRVQVVVEPAGSLALRYCNTSSTCANNVMDNYETGVDCGGDCAPCTTLDLSLPVINYGNYSSPRINGTIPVSYISYDYVFVGNASTAQTVVIGNGRTYGQYFNGPLSASTTYHFRLLAFTGNSSALMSASLGGCAPGSNNAVASTLNVPPNDSSNSSNAGAIIGAVIVIIVVAVLVIVFVYRRKKGLSNDPRDWFGRSGGGGGSSSGGGRSGGYSERGSAYVDRPLTSPNNPYGTSASSTTLTSPSAYTPYAPTAAASSAAAAPPPVVVVPKPSAPAPVRPTGAAPLVVARPADGYANVTGAGAGGAGAGAVVGAGATSSNGLGADGLPRFRGACVISNIEFPPAERKEVPVEDLGRVIQQMSADSNLVFCEEYESIETGATIPCTRASMPENKMKNRYANILSYDHSRVVLPLLDNDPLTDYINANYMDGFQAPSYYIAAQGPTPATVADFWRMIWENRCQVVIMVTNLEEKGRVKCHRYWPEKVHQELAISPTMAVSMAAEEEFPDYIIRTLTLQCGNQSRVVRQFHYISWPDHGVPESTAVTIAILRKARAARTPNGGPTVVHCSAGVGRTGTLIAIDYNLEAAAKLQTVDVLGTLNEMRRQRSTMVQTDEQYVFIYQTLMDGCSQNVTELSPEGIREHYSQLHNPQENGSTLLENEFKKVSDFAPPQLRTDSAQLTANKPKNRFQNILPYETTRVKLLAIPGVVGSDYINASFVDGYKQKNAFIATQGPLEDTVPDFWRMVWERECRCLVMLTALSESGRVKSEQYWPDPDEPPLSAGDFQIVLRGERNLGWVVERTLQIVDLVSETAREVKHWQYMAWPASGCPESGRNLIQLIQMVEQYERSLLVVQEESIYGNAKAIEEQSVLRQLRPCVVHCSAGVARTGVFCAVAISIKRFQEEQKMDLVTLTKHLRTQRPAMIQTAEQYEFVYRCMVDYMDMSVAPIVAATETIYQNLDTAPARAKRVPPKPPTRTTPAVVAMAPEHTLSITDGETQANVRDTSWDFPSASTDYQESSFMMSNPQQDSFGFGEEA